MDYNKYQVGDIVESKKKHPCGSNKWKVLRIGVDFKFQCLGCDHIIILPRPKALHHMKNLVSRSNESPQSDTDLEK